MNVHLDNSKRISEHINSHRITQDDIKDIALAIVDNLVQEELVPDCMDTSADTEFQFQDLIREHLFTLFKINPS